MVGHLVDVMVQQVIGLLPPRLDVLAAPLLDQHRMTLLDGRTALERRHGSLGVFENMGYHKGAKAVNDSAPSRHNIINNMLHAHKLLSWVDNISA